MNKSDSIQTTKDKAGKEVVMTRADKTLKQLMEEKPSSRWDPLYWHPKYDESIQKISYKVKISTLKELLNESIIAPDHVRASKGESVGKKFECEYRTLKDLMFTGLNYADINFCSNNACERLKRSKLRISDILLAGSGIGAIGRVGIVTKVSDKSCVGDLFIIRNPKINPYYILILLLCEFGQMQIERIFHGIQSAKISTDEIGAIKIPILPKLIQDAVQTNYSKMSSFHDLAMKAKISGKVTDYKKKLGIAEKMLKELITKIEEIIRGERDELN